MKVVHVITGLRIGGAETQLRLLLRHSQAEASVIALTNANEMAEAIREDGVTVHDLAMRGNRDLRALPRLTRIIAREQPDIVHVHLYRATLYGRIAARLARVPVVITTEHSLLDGVIEGRRSTNAVRALYQGTELLNNVTIAVSQEVADRLIAWGIPDRKIIVLPNGVDLEVLGDAMRHREALRRELGIADDTEVIGGIGRLAQNRRWDLLIRAVAPVLGPRRQLVLLGSGSEEQRLRDLTAALHVEQWVRLLPARLDVVPMLSVFDVVASTAPQETFGLALLEALAAGRKVVYVHCPALDSIGQLPGSVRVPGEEGPLREALLNSLRARADGSPRASLEHVNIRNVAAAVDNMYESYLSRK